MPSSGPSVRKHARLPSRREDSSLAALFRRKLNRIYFPYLFQGSLPILALVYVVERQVDSGLRIFGYSNEFVSSFAFIKALYLNVTATEALGRIDIGYFHILDAVLWVTIVAWTIWLIAGIVLLKEYDRFLQRVSDVLSAKFGIFHFLADLIMLLMLPFFLLVAHLVAQPKLMASPEIFLVLRYIPGAFFFALATCFYVGGPFSSISILYFIWRLWKLFPWNRSETVR